MADIWEQVSIIARVGHGFDREAPVVVTETMSFASFSNMSDAGVGKLVRGAATIDRWDTLTFLAILKHRESGKKAWAAPKISRQMFDIMDDSQLGANLRDRLMEKITSLGPPPRKALA